MLTMRLTFLLGPAGTGKTFQCLHEIRQALKASPEGPPLIFLAPKQATFQLETELLSDPELPGYTRLKIVSFDTLAELILAECSPAAPKILNDEGRVMVLRALLARHYGELQIFRASARLPGFAQHLSRLLTELQHYHFTPQRLLDAAAQATLPQLSEKLQDLALLLRAYQDWLRENDLHDPNTLLSFAAELATQAIKEFHFSGLWLDGFAEMTPQEIELLAALIPACDTATLAFCLGQPPKPGDLDWLSIWGTIGQTFRNLHTRLTAIPGVQSEITILPRRPSQSRFENNPVFAHLERHWSKPEPYQLSTINHQLSTISCPNPEAEAVVAAREILKHVQAGGRFRETAVLVRSLDNYHHALRRVFTRYEIPFFLDRRESISHHSVAELTRYALRLAIYGWEHDDWFGILKTGLVHENTVLIDRLENAALARGWRGREFWRKPIEGDPELEELRQLLVPPFERWLTRLQGQITGNQFATALRNLWSDLEVATKLEQWSQEAGEDADADAILHARIHESVPQEMQRWLENIELAFAQTPLSLADWLGIADAGLASLTVGIVPPALDQVLIGAVDRSRNPDLKLLVGLGLNELVFPAVPAPPPLLSEPDRKALLDVGVVLGPDQRQQIGRERFLGYILCTRARERLVLTYARRNSKDKALNPSIFIGHLQQLFPGLQPEEFHSVSWNDALHTTEVIVPLLKNLNLNLNPNLNLPPTLTSVLDRWRHITRSREITRLSPGLAERLYTPTLETSISDLEEYAACPFKFFVRRGLRAAEREEFEIDVRQRGSFQHEIMMAFHRELQAQGRRWRDISPAEARQLVGRIGEELQQTFRNGLFAGAPDRQFNARLLIRALQDLVAVLVGWAPQYLFEPTAVEIGFGLDQGGFKPWRIDLGRANHRSADFQSAVSQASQPANPGPKPDAPGDPKAPIGRANPPAEPSHALLLRGRIDRVDLHRRIDGAADVVVVDYKSSGQELKEIKLQNGLDLQLLAYLGVLRDQPEATRIFQAQALVPAGAFYVRLRGGSGSATSRLEVIANREEEFQKTYQHRGRFQAELLRTFDNRDTTKGNQFKYKLNKDRTLSKTGNEALEGPAFTALVEQIKNFLKQYGEEIYNGEAALKPYRLNHDTACDYCEYGAICRFDPWLQPFRNLKQGEPSR